VAERARGIDEARFLEEIEAVARGKPQ